MLITLRVFNFSRWMKKQVKPAAAKLSNKNMAPWAPMSPWPKQGMFLELDKRNLCLPCEWAGQPLPCVPRSLGRIDLLHLLHRFRFSLECFFLGGGGEVFPQKSVQPKSTYNWFITQIRTVFVVDRASFGPHINQQMSLKSINLQT